MRVALLGLACLIVRIAATTTVAIVLGMNGPEPSVACS